MKLINSLILLLIAQYTFCQKLKYDDYAFPDMNIKGMYVTGFTDFQNDLFDDNSYKRFSIKATSGQFTLQNSRKKQRYSRNHFELRYGNSESTFGGGKDYNDHYSFSGTYYNERRKFRTSGKRNREIFREFNQLLDFSVNYAPQFWGNFEYKRDVNVYLSLPIKFGIGRIEPIAYLNIAEFLAEDLKNEGIIEFPLSEDDIFDLAGKLVSVASERIFDRRKAYIYQLTELSNWFYLNNIPNNIHSFSILNDNLLFVNAGITRGRGIQNTLAIEPIIFQNYVDDAFLGLGLFYTLNIQKNISKKFHHDFRFKTGFEALTFEAYDLFMLASSSYSLNYSPNSRTLISLIPKADFYYNEYSPRNLLLTCKATMSYFINYNLRLEAYVSGNYTYYDDEDVSGYKPYTLRYDAFDPVFYRLNYNEMPYYFSASGNTNFLWGYVSLNYNLY